jgi:hypothetical protein
MGRRKLFTTFPRRLLDDDMFIRMSSEARHLLFHLYAYLHPHGRAPMSELMLSRYFVPQLFPTWTVAMDELVKNGFIETYTYCGDMFFSIDGYDEDQPANLLRDRTECSYPCVEDDDGSAAVHPVLTQEINCEKTETIRKEKKRRKKKTSEEMSGEFMEWYKLYPRRDGPKDPWAAWQKALARGVNPVDIMDGLHSALANGAFSNERKYICMASTWINQERWLADYSKPVSEMDNEDLDMLKRMQGGD